MKQIRIWCWGNLERLCRIWEEGRTWSFKTTDTVEEILARYPEHEIVEVKV